jgi:dipeptidyl aminopeptidase/acylaminoacyl peptidase
MKFRLCVRLLGCLVALLAPIAAKSADSDLDRVLGELERVHSLSGVSISPDGRWIAWVTTNTKSQDGLYLLDWKKAGARAKHVTIGENPGGEDASEIAWSSNSSQFAFLSHGETSQDQIYVADPASPKPRKISTLDGHVTGLRFGRGDKDVTFLYAEHGGGGGPLEAEPAAIGEIGREIHNQRIAILPLAGGEIRQVTPPELNIYEYDRSPDGSRFAAIAAPGPADNNWWTAKLYSVSANGGKMTVLFTPPTDRQIAVPRWSPDGKQIGFLAGLMSDEGFNGGDLFLIAENGGEAKNLTRQSKTTPNGLRWRNNDTILFSEAVNGGGGLATIKISTGETEQLWSGAQAINEDGNFPNFSVAQDGVTSAFVRSTWEQAPEVTAGPIGDWKAITSENSQQKRYWGKAESLDWQNANYRSQGWLLYPQNFDPNKRYPMIVSIHGGPSGMRASSWPSVHFDMSVMAAMGYFVFYPNPRGSFGGGEAFTRANVKDFGGGDLSDILAGVDAVLKKVPVDAQRIGVTGWSYGGYMTMWTVTQTNRFRAAVAGAGIANWLSYYGQNSIDQWMIPFFGASVYDDPAVYAKSAPITYIKNVKTPTLVVVGERDGECPAPQSFEFWHALKAQNVPTKLVVYSGEGHSFREPKNRLDVLKRTAEWFNQYLQ